MIDIPPTDGINIASAKDHGDGDGKDAEARTLPEVPTTPDALRSWRKEFADSLQEADYLVYSYGTTKNYHKPNKVLGNISEPKTAKEMESLEEHGLGLPDAKGAMATDVVSDIGETFDLHADQLHDKIFTSSDDDHLVVEIGRMDQTDQRQSNLMASAFKVQFPKSAKAAYDSFVAYVQAQPDVAFHLAIQRINNIYNLDGSYSKYLPASAVDPDKVGLDAGKGELHSRRATKTQGGKTYDVAVWSKDELPETTEPHTAVAAMLDEDQKAVNAAAMLDTLQSELKISMGETATERFSQLFAAIEASITDPKERAKIVEKLVAALKKRGDTHDQSTGRFHLYDQFVTLGDTDILLPNLPNPATILVHLSGTKNAFNISPTLENFLEELNKPVEKPKD